ncbi:RHS repeat-associated core domain-containing protein, partial [Lysobacter fragariae]
GAVVNQMDFLAFGARRDFDTQTAGGTPPSLTTRGFTGHETVDGVLGLIHMNGRIFDPGLGRFLQADPVIQAPDNAQSWNAYTYCFNNPLTYVDPTGRMSQSVRQVLAIVIIVVAAITQQYWAIKGAAAFWYAVGTGFLAGYASTGTLQGGLYGAFSGALFYGIGTYFQNAQWAQATAANNAFGSGLTWGGYGAKVLAHGTAGGVMSRLQGGKFGNGFASAGVTEAFAPAIGGIGNGERSYAPARVAAAAILGGTTSVIAGGKFANGAITAAFSRAFNDEIHDNSAWPDDENYDSNDPTYHKWTEVNAICDESAAGCSVVEVTPHALKYSYPSEGGRATSPGYLDGRPVVVYGANPFSTSFGPQDMNIPGGRVIQQQMAAGIVRNITLRDHVFYPGTITRVVVSSGGKVWMVTHGVGINTATPSTYVNIRLGALNDSRGPMLFRALDSEVRTSWQEMH